MIPTIYNLKKDLLGKIFCDLDPQCLGRCAQVCKSFNKILKNDLIWKEVYYKLNPSDHNKLHTFDDYNTNYSTLVRTTVRRIKNIKKLIYTHGPLERINFINQEWLLEMPPKKNSLTIRNLRSGNICKYEIPQGKIINFKDKSFVLSTEDKNKNSFKISIFNFKKELLPLKEAPRDTNYKFVNEIETSPENCFRGCEALTDTLVFVEKEENKYVLKLWNLETGQLFSCDKNSEINQEIAKSFELRQVLYKFIDHYLSFTLIDKEKIIIFDLKKDEMKTYFLKINEGKCAITYPVYIRIPDSKKESSDTFETLDLITGKQHALSVGVKPILECRYMPKENVTCIVAGNIFKMFDLNKKTTQNTLDSTHICTLTHPPIDEEGKFPAWYRIGEFYVSSSLKNSTLIWNIRGEKVKEFPYKNTKVINDYVISYLPPDFPGGLTIWDIKNNQPHCQMPWKSSCERLRILEVTDSYVFLNDFTPSIVGVDTSPLSKIFIFDIKNNNFIKLFIELKTSVQYADFIGNTLIISCENPVPNAPPGKYLFDFK